MKLLYAIYICYRFKNSKLVHTHRCGNTDFYWGPRGAKQQYCAARDYIAHSHPRVERWIGKYL